MSKPSVVIIIVNWNGKKDTLELLTSLSALRSSRYDVLPVVVDNASSDGSVTEITKTFPAVRVLPQRKNLGFTGGNNAGIRYAMDTGASFLWFLNNDTTVAPGALSLCDALGEGVGGAASKIYFAAGREFHRDRYTAGERGKVIWYAGGSIDWDNMYASHRGVDEVDRGQFDQAGDTDFLTGCSFMVSRATVERVGVFDDRYYLYLEDVDYSLRIRNAGLRTVYAPDSVVWHTNAGSSGGPGSRTHEYYQTRNRLLVGMRYAPFRTRAALIRESVRYLMGGPAVRRQAVADAVLGRWGKQHE